MEKQGNVTSTDQVDLHLGEPVTRAEEALRAATANKTRLGELEKAVAQQAENLTLLRKYTPPMAAKRARRIRLAFEVAGVAIAAIGAWWIYPPAALLLVGAWMLGDVLAMRRAKKKRSE